MPERESRVQIIRVPAGARWTVVCTATRLATVYTHFTDGRTQPCQREQGDCGPCCLGLSRRFEAYMGCWVHTKNRECVLALPEGAYRAIAAHLGDKLDGHLRGEWFTLSRKGTSRRSPLDVEHLGQGNIIGPVPRGLDVPAILYRCWGIPYKRPGQGGQGRSQGNAAAG